MQRCPSGHAGQHAVMRCPVPGCAHGPTGVARDQLRVLTMLGPAEGDDEMVDCGLFERTQIDGGWRWLELGRYRRRRAQLRNVPVSPFGDVR